MNSDGPIFPDQVAKNSESSMTTSAEEVLKELTDDNLCELTLTWYDPSKQRLIGALEAVLAMPEKDPMLEAFVERAHFDHGYNQCLADVRAIIEKGVK